VAQRINKAMGQRVALRYREKVGLPGSCFGDTRYWVDDVTPVGDPAPAPLLAPLPAAALPAPPAVAAPATPAVPLPGTPGAPAAAR